MFVCTGVVLDVVVVVVDVDIVKIEVKELLLG